jgi:hypothetical protein
VASSGVTFRATLREHFLGETGHERGPAETVCAITSVKVVEKRVSE